MQSEFIKKLNKLKEEKKKQIVKQNIVIQQTKESEPLKETYGRRNESGKVIYDLSFSEFSTFIQCPHKWFLEYMMKVKSPGNEELVFGSSVHNTIEYVLTHLNEKVNYKEKFSEFLISEIKGLKDVLLLNKLNNSQLINELIGQGTKLVSEIFKSELLKGYRIVSVEFDLENLPICETEEMEIRYKGFIDLVLMNKETGRYLIIDWKTSKKKWDIKKKESDSNFYNQLMLYKYYYSIENNIDIELIDTCFVNLPRENELEIARYDKEFNKDSIEEFINWFKLESSKMFDSDFFKMPKAKFVTKKNFCYFCSHNNHYECNDTNFHQIVKLK